MIDLLYKLFLFLEKRRCICNGKPSATGEGRSFALYIFSSTFKRFGLPPTLPFRLSTIFESTEFNAELWSEVPNLRTKRAEDLS